MTQVDDLRRDVAIMIEDALPGESVFGSGSPLAGSILNGMARDRLLAQADQVLRMVGQRMVQDQAIDSAAEAIHDVPIIERIQGIETRRLNPDYNSTDLRCAHAAIRRAARAAGVPVPPMPQGLQMKGAEVSDGIV